MTFDKVVMYIDDVPLPTPAYGGYTTKKEELVKAERNVGTSLNVTSTISFIKNYGKGYLIKRHIAWKYTVTVEWKGLTAAEKTAIMELTGQISDEDDISIDSGIKVTFLDLDTDTYLTKYMYRGNDQTISGYGRLGPDNKFEYYDVKMSLIEL